MNLLNQEILSAIDNIDNIVQESEINVLKALCDCYEKQAMILEYSTSEDVSEFSVFQEGFKDVLNEAKGNKGENIVKKILLFIPRLLRAIGRAIKKLWDNRHSKALRNRIDELERQISKLSETQKNDLLKLYDRISDNEMRRDNKDIDRNYSQFRTDEKIHKRLDELEKSNKDLKEKTDYLEKENRDTSRSVRRLTDLEHALKGTVMSCVNFEKVYEYLKELNKTIEEIGSWDIYKPSTFPKSVLKGLDELKNTSTWDYHNNTVFFGMGKNTHYVEYTFSDVKKYMDEINSLGRSISKDSLKLEHKMYELADNYQDTVSGKKDGKPNTRQKELLDQIYKVRDYLSRAYSRVSSETLGYINNQYDHMSDEFGRYLKMISGVVRKEEQ